MYSVGKEIRDKLSGAVEAFSRKNVAGTPHRDHPRHKSSDDGPSSKHVVNFFISNSDWLNFLPGRMMIFLLLLFDQIKSCML